MRQQIRNQLVYDIRGQLLRLEKAMLTLETQRGLAKFHFVGPIPRCWGMIKSWIAATRTSKLQLSQ